MAGVAVVSAFNPDNYGMYSVDLAAQQFFADLGMPVAQVVTQGPRRVGRLHLRLVRTAQDLAAFDTVVYWGDFLNNPVWGEDDYSTREVKRGWSSTREAALASWRELYLDLRPRAPGTRIFVVGGCFLGADEWMAANSDAGFTDFLRGADRVLPRDPSSHALLQRLVPEARVEAGMDCAWLLDHPSASKRRQADYFVCFLGRTLRGQGRSLLRDLARQSGLRPVWIDWLNLDKPRFIADWRFRQLHRLIAGARFVVTDTYHLLINTLARGVPAICLHDGSQLRQDGTLGDHKKSLLMTQLGLSWLLVDVAATADIVAAIRQRGEACAGGEFATAARDLMDRRDGYRRRLRELFKPGELWSSRS